MPNHVECTAIALALVALSCSPAAPPLSPRPASTPALHAQQLTGPAPSESRWPELAASDAGRIVLSWSQPQAEQEYSLETSEWDGSTWTTPRSVARGPDWFVNWADFPTVAAVANRRWATWLAKLGEGTYAYGVYHASSVDGGVTWEEHGLLHSDRSESEHGFVSLVPLADGRFNAVWLDGRNTVGGDHAGGHSHGSGGAMALYTAVLESGAPPRRETMLDDRVCDCCQTSSVVLDDGTVVVAYRDRAQDETRDIGIVRGRPGLPDSWSAPALIHDDGWIIKGCPVNGPALSASGQDVAAAWFTLGTTDTPIVQLATSNTGGETFDSPVRVDSGSPIGRVDIVHASPRLLVVTWLEETEGGASWMGRTVTLPTMELGPVTIVAPGSGGRSDGSLRLARTPSGVLAAWTDSEPRVQVARLTVK